MAAIQGHHFSARYDSGFVYASVDADIIRLIVRNGLVVGRMVDTECVGRLIYTKSIGSDRPENLTQNYKGKKGKTMSTVCKALTNLNGTYNEENTFEFAE